MDYTNLIIALTGIVIGISWCTVIIIKLLTLT